MVTAIIVVFLALFGGAAVLGLMIWMISRRNRDNSSSNNFVGTPNPASYQTPQSNIAFDHETDDTDFVDNSYFTNETANKEQTAYDSAASVENYESASTQNDYSAPAESSYSDSSSYDSGGSSDSGSSSSSSD